MALTDLWYVALPARDLPRGRLVHRRLDGQPVVFGRDAATGKAFALRDLCPHRGVPLSKGRMVEGTIECPYHGWRIAPDGRCARIPSLLPEQQFETERIRVRTYAVREQYGLIWVYLGDRPGAPAGRQCGRGGTAGIPGPAAGRAAAPCRDDGVCGRHRPCRDRPDRPGPCGLRAQSLVVAGAQVDPDQGKGVRAIGPGLHHGPPQAILQFRRLQAAAWRSLDGDRLSPARRADRAHPDGSPPASGRSISSASPC